MLRLEPEDTLRFSSESCLSSSPSRQLKLTNINKQNVAFKVKTTAPRSYLVRPSFGTLQPGASQEVQIIFQTQSGEANNHRFLVQAVTVGQNQQVTREGWAQFSKDAIDEQRLTVTFDAPGPGVGNFSGSTSQHSAAAEHPADLKVKYDELVQYTLLLEKDKKKMEAELIELVRKDSKGSRSAASGIEMWKAVIVAIIAFFLTYEAQSRFFQS